ncbi:MAG TPA: hypothetical protein VHZ76_04660, partial [Gammaproteobacteria bacterium]|nr:hypothetical protein [Gammaproteobacteria bacterium]
MASARVVVKKAIPLRQLRDLIFTVIKDLDENKKNAFYGSFPDDRYVGSYDEKRAVTADDCFIALRILNITDGTELTSGNHDKESPGKESAQQLIHFIIPALKHDFTSSISIARNPGLSMKVLEEATLKRNWLKKKKHCSKNPLKVIHALSLAALLGRYGGFCGDNITLLTKLSNADTFKLLKSLRQLQRETFNPDMSKTIFLTDEFYCKFILRIFSYLYNYLGDPWKYRYLETSLFKMLSMENYRIDASMSIWHRTAAMMEPPHLFETSWATKVDEMVIDNLVESEKIKIRDHYDEHKSKSHSHKKHSSPPTTSPS